MKRLVLTCFTILVLTVSARTDETDAAQKLFSAVDITSRTALLKQIEQTAGQPQSVYALGAMQFFVALERFAQGLHDHGFQTPRTMLLPLMRLPVPANPQARPITYEQWRRMLQDLNDGLVQAGQTLATVPDSATIAIEVDLARLRIDLNGDGLLTGDESLAAMMLSMSAPGRSRGADADGQPQLPAFLFDRADGYWLEGYARFLIANTEFWLAHDFETSFNTGFQLFFPNTRFPIDQYAGAPADAERLRAVQNQAGRGGMFENSIFDLVSLIHTVNWEVVEPERRRAIRTHLLEMIRLSRRNWQAIEAETDNDREWLPGPQQPGTHPLTGLDVSQETVDGWQDALDVFEMVLNGDALIPHPRFNDVGINLKRFFEEPARFDLVLSITGPAMLPFVEPGNVLSGSQWRQVTRQFGRRNFWAFAVWFN